jgi:hypothetical protein
VKSVLGIDLGLSWQSTGSAVVSFDGDLWLRCTLGPIVWPETECNARLIAASIVEFALRNRIAAVSFDGPQGWRDPVGAGTFVGRECERLTRTPGKTGTFGVSIPGTWIRWIRSSIHVFDALLDSGHAIMANSAEQQVMPPLPEGSFYVLECFPTSTWRSAGLQSLPSHHIDLPTVWRFAQNLLVAVGLPDLISAESSLLGTDHDNVQALVAALPAAGLLGAPCHAIPRGLPGRVVPARDRIPPHRVEGFIWDAIPRRTSFRR